MDAAISVIGNRFNALKEGLPSACQFKRYEEDFMSVVENNGFVVSIGEKWMYYKLKPYCEHVG